MTDNEWAKLQSMVGLDPEDLERYSIVNELLKGVIDDLGSILGKREELPNIDRATGKWFVESQRRHHALLDKLESLQLEQLKRGMKDLGRRMHTRGREL